MTRLLDAFGVTTSSTSPVGMTSGRTDKPCPSCRAIDILIEPGRGLHAAEYVCSVCGAHRGWMSREVFNFVSGCVVASLKTTGRRPEEPIVIRSKNSCSSTNKPRPQPQSQPQPQPRS
jgi:hypothetical protein